MRASYRHVGIHQKHIRRRVIASGDGVHRQQLPKLELADSI